MAYSYATRKPGFIIIPVVIAVLALVLLGGAIAAFAYYHDGTVKKVGDIGFGETSSTIAPAKASDCDKSPNNYGCKAPNIVTGINSVFDPTGNGNNGVPYFSQSDSRYRYDQIYPGKNFSVWGCCPTSAAMVLRYYNKPVDPIIIGTYAVSAKFYVGSGTDHRDLIPALASKYGLTSKVTGTNWDAIIGYLKDNKPIIARGQYGRPFSNGGHCVVFSSYDASTDSIYVLNPARNLGMGYFPVSTLKTYMTVSYYLGP